MGGAFLDLSCGRGGGSRVGAGPAAHGTLSATAPNFTRRQAEAALVFDTAAPLPGGNDAARDQAASLTAASCAAAIFASPPFAHDPVGSDDFDIADAEESRGRRSATGS